MSLSHTEPALGGETYHRTDWSILGDDKFWDVRFLNDGENYEIFITNV